MASVGLIIGLVVTIYSILVIIILSIFYKIMERNQLVTASYRQLLDENGIDYSSSSYLS